MIRKGKKRDGCRVLTERRTEKRTLRRPTRRLEDNIKVNLQETVVTARSELISIKMGTSYGLLYCRHGNEPSVSINCGEFLD